ncbi:hypothetical protein M427DRAFT_145333 [Gonapodya prolifera JEL478]|uniref:Uncharacterized protein n=1 Tax=Gonapodya prolifera (strain JEL478) TaxID=1344416 RepID=A0A139AGE0_GONPJ|nr:hypothetical protein M427DRAFT_145333 [Gonapodya prolifera JEL478]|eukprot:KXS15818.1 hypothetical protein M427DRAFT_145333 [Gonapodya prolifera JEL478]
MGNICGSPEPKSGHRLGGDTPPQTRAYGSTTSPASPTQLAAPPQAYVPDSTQRTKIAASDEDRVARLAGGCTVVPSRAAEQRAKANQDRGAKSGALSQRLQQQRTGKEDVSTTAEDRKTNELVEGVRILPSRTPQNVS